MDHLSQDFILADLISRYDGEILESRGHAFETLLRSIVGQQISVKAADSIWRRVQVLLVQTDPSSVLEKTPEELRECGLSGQKVSYVRDLATHFASGKVNPETWPSMTDEEIILDLTKVRGIGRWSAEMFLIFHLLRPDVLPVADLGLQKSAALHFGKKYPMSAKALTTLAKSWRPYRSVATWYLWRALDPVPVEY